MTDASSSSPAPEPAAGGDSETGSTVSAPAAQLGASRELIAQTILCLGEDVAKACVEEPLWIRRYRLGDTTALSGQIAGACAKQGLPYQAYAEALRKDPKLARLQDSTVERAVGEAEQALLASSRLRRTIIIGGPVILAACLVMYLGKWYASSVAEEKKAEDARLHPTLPAPAATPGAPSTAEAPAPTPPAAPATP